MNRQLESITKGTTERFTVRVWRTEDSLDGINNSDIQSEIKKCHYYQTQQQVAEDLEKFPRVAAVEVLDTNGNGIVVYPDWK